MRIWMSIFIVFLVGCSPEQQPTNLGGFIVEPQSADKKQINLLNLIPKEGAVVNFWASWCEPCRKEMPQLEQLSEKLKVLNIVVLLISIDEDQFLFEEYLLKYPQKLKVYRAMASTGPDALPTTYIVDFEGNITKVYAGVRDWTNDDIAADIIQSLKK